MMKLYEKYLEDVQMKHRLSHIEIAIIGFLYNNPERDTAADIVERRMLPKGNVSAGVETLVQKGLLMRRQDQTDRRKIHLSLLEKAVQMCIRDRRCFTISEDFCSIQKGYLTKKQGQSWQKKY